MRLFGLVSNFDPVINMIHPFVADIYVAILGHEELSRRTAGWAVPFLPLLSTRAQDFSLSHYVLGVKYTQLDRT